jgi:hypothetical protein
MYMYIRGRPEYRDTIIVPPCLAGPSKESLRRHVKSSDPFGCRHVICVDKGVPVQVCSDLSEGNRGNQRLAALTGDRWSRYPGAPTAAL